MHRRSATWALTIALLVLLGLPGSARADVVRPPPRSCPPGSTGETSHAGPYCRLHRCTGDSSCNKRSVCQSRKLCIGLKVVGGGRGHRGRPVEAVFGPCEGGRACAAGGTCKAVKVCVRSAR